MALRTSEPNDARPEPLARKASAPSDEDDDAAEWVGVTGDFAPRWCELFGPVGPPVPNRHTNVTSARNFLP